MHVRNLEKKALIVCPLRKVNAKLNFDSGSRNDSTSTFHVPSLAQTSPSVSIPSPPHSVQLSVDEATGPIISVPSLPDFVEMSGADFNWGSIADVRSFIDDVDKAYAEVVHWRQNQFMLPSGKEGKAFVSELARLFQFYGESSPPRENSIEVCHDTTLSHSAEATF